MFVKSIGLNLESEKERHAVVKAINKRMLPRLSREAGLREANVLDFAATDLMAVLVFDGADPGRANLTEALDLACRQQNLEVDSARFIEREHPLISEGRA